MLLFLSFTQTRRVWAPAWGLEILNSKDFLPALTEKGSSLPHVGERFLMVVLLALSVAYHSSMSPPSSKKLKEKTM